MGRLLQQQAETFQSQIRQLQESLKARDLKPVKTVPQYRYHNEPNEGPNPFDDESPRKWTFDDIMGESYPKSTLERRLAGRIAKRIARAREKREDAELNRAMRELSLDDYDDHDEQGVPMDTSNAIRGIPLELAQDENGKIMLVQKKR